MWNKFDGKPYDRASLADHIAALKFADWKPSFIVYHNTSEPTIKLWLSWPEAKRQQYIVNVEQMYENEDHWHAGPHFFVPPTATPCCFGFSNPEASGVHASCFNGQSIGIEQVGEFNVEHYNDGPGAIVRDNAVYLGALLYRKLGIAPDHNTLKFHIECARDNHDCPGTFARDKDALIALIKAEMARQAGPLSSSPTNGPSTSPSPTASPGDAATTSPSSTARFATIMTMFAGRGDPETSAYTGKRIDASVPGFALPFHFPDPRPRIRVYANGKTCEGPLVDVGPGATHDKYWETGTKPIAGNGAGIDATDAVWDALGIHDDRRGKTAVEWEFIPALGA